MPIHDWTRVDAAIFHHFQLHWIGAIASILNQGLLPEEFYALIELSTKADLPTAERSTSLKVEDDRERFPRKQSIIAVRHITEDCLVAVIEVVSRGSRPGRNSLRLFVGEAAGFLNRGVHLMMLDLEPTTRGVSAENQGTSEEQVAGELGSRPVNKPFTLASYESGGRSLVFLEPVGVGDNLINLPLFLEPGRYVPVPLEESYRTAFESVPRRWRTILERAL